MGLALLASLTTSIGGRAEPFHNGFNFNRSHAKQFLITKINLWCATAQSNIGNIFEFEFSRYIDTVYKNVSLDFWAIPTTLLAH